MGSISSLAILKTGKIGIQRFFFVVVVVFLVLSFFAPVSAANTMLCFPRSSESQEHLSTADHG